MSPPYSPPTLPHSSPPLPPPATAPIRSAVVCVVATSRVLWATQQLSLAYWWCWYPVGRKRRVLRGGDRQEQKRSALHPASHNGLSVLTAKRHSLGWHCFVRLINRVSWFSQSSSIILLHFPLMLIFLSFPCVFFAFFPLSFEYFYIILLFRTFFHIPSITRV